MLWLLFSLLAGSLYTVEGLLARRALNGDRDAFAFSFYFSLVGALTSLPFMLLAPKFSTHWLMWLVLLVVGGLIVLQNYLNFRSTNFLAPSIQGAISKFRLLWVLLIGLIFLGESFSWLKIAGVQLTVMAGLIIYLKSAKTYSRFGMWLAFLATLAYAVVIGLYKLLFSEFNSATLTFFIFAIPALINLIIMPNAVARIKTMFVTQGMLVLVATFLGGLANLAMNYALSIGEASRVLVIMEAFLLMVLFGEHFFLKEKTDFGKKLFAVLLAMAGAILMQVAK